MACLLLGLPNELLLQIIHSVANADLDSFTSTCKTLRSLADDALRGHRARKAMYAHITYGDPEENDPRTTWVHPTLILRDLLRDDLFSYPRTFSINDHTYEGAEWDDGRVYSGIDRECVGDRHSEVYHALQELPDDVGPLVKVCPYINRDDDLIRGILEEGDIGATLGLLISLLPNLTGLEITDYNDGSDGIANLKQILDEMLNFNVDAINLNHGESTYPICKLRELSITRSDQGSHGDDWDISMYAPLFYLPSMQSISVGYLRTAGELWSYSGHHSCLKRLSLQSANMDLQSFETYTKDIENLHELRLSLKATSGIHGPNLLPVGQAIQALLSSAGHSLRHLEVGTAKCTPPRYSANYPYTGSLRGFQVLETVKIPAYMLIAPLQRSEDLGTASLDHPSRLIDYFPPSLVRITFTGNLSRLPGLKLISNTQIIIDMLQELPETKSEFLPLLESVVFEYIVSSFRYRDLDLLRQCREVGVIVADRGHEKE